MPLSDREIARALVRLEQKRRGNGLDEWKIPARPGGSYASCGSNRGIRRFAFEEAEI
jgi:hypothetical protein